MCKEKRISEILEYFPSGRTQPFVGIKIGVVQYTVFHTLVRDILLNFFGIFPWMMGQYFSYLLPKQAP